MHRRKTTSGSLRVLHACTRAPVAWARIVGVPNAYQTSWSDLGRYLLGESLRREETVDELLCPSPPDAEIITALRAIFCLHFCRYFHMNYRYFRDKALFSERNDEERYFRLCFYFYFFFKLLLQIVCGHVLIKQ